MTDEDSEIECATYTHARRHPMVLGRIGSWTPPFQLSLTQLAVLAAALLIEMRTWRYWGAYLPRTMGVVVAVAVPCVLAWAVRRARVEGRSLPRAAVGWLTYLWMAPIARVAGRPYQPARSASLRHAEVFVASGRRRA